MSHLRKRRQARQLHRWAAFVALVGALALVAGCSGGGGEASPTPLTTIVDVNGPRATEGTSAPRPEDVAVRQATSAWSTLWSSAALKTPDGDTAAAAVASPEAVRSVSDRIRTAGTAVTSPKVDYDYNTNTVTIADCIVGTPPILASSGLAFDGTATAGPDGTWRIATAKPNATEMCVPKAMAEAAIKSYEAYYEDQQHWWGPPDPTSPLLAQRLTGSQLEHERQVLTTYPSRDAQLKGEPVLHPEVTSITSTTEVQLRDCQLLSDSYGLFDPATGARLDGIAAPDPAQPRYLRTADMQLVDGAWKVSILQGSALKLSPGEEVACDFAPSDRGLPVR